MKQSKWIVVLGVIATVFTLIHNIMQVKADVDNERAKRERNEIFFSDYQDQVQCKLDSLKIKNCQQ
jgi:hypothetical protein